jgi:putative heme-binding domain-containing protein
MNRLPTLGLILSLPMLAAAGPLELKPGDHICIVGNTLAERMQHDGWLETLLHAAYPKHQLVFRNLGFSGDEITLRLRSADFGTPDEWLTKCKADVIFAFFGYNESFAGEAGLGKFTQDFDKYVKHLKGMKYNGSTPPRVAVFSPIAHEDLKDPRLPDGKDNNGRMSLYSAAMAKVAKDNDVAFVDLFQLTKDHERKANRLDVALTTDGIHLNETGHRMVAWDVMKELGQPDGSLSEELLFDKLRPAVNDKNFHWFERYRTTDGYSIFGGRADLKFVNNQTNREVAQREMEILDVMTTNRDKVVWAAAQGQSIKPDDSNLPPLIPVITNKPGSGPNGEHVYLSGEESIQRMKVGKGLKVELYASEEQFPELAKPVQMTWDAKGRLWVAVWPSYPHWKPTEPMNDKILIFEDTKGTGKADKMTVFADGLHNPTGLELYDGGVLVAQAPDLMFLKDRQGTGKADLRQRVLHGLDSADTHHTANSFVLDPGGALYFQEGTFHHTQVETPWGPPVRNANAGVYRYEPRGHKFDVYVPFGFANPHGHAFDRWGQDIVIDGTGSQPYHAALFSGHLPFPQKHPGPPQVYQQRTRPCPAIEYLSSRHFPEEFQGNLLVGNVIGFQGIQRYRIDDDGASFKGTELEPILSSSDPNFRPSDMKIGPDGALYFIDWHNPIIGHMQHNLRDPSRDRSHGRIYRVTCEGRPLLKPPLIEGESIERLLELLKEPEDRVRYRVRGELGTRPTKEVLPALEKWVAQLDRADPAFEHHRLEALWVQQWHDTVDHSLVSLLQQVLTSPDFRARAAAARVLCYQRQHVRNALGVCRLLAEDPHPRVRLEAVRCASFFTVPEAVEIVLSAESKQSDKYLDYVVKESMRALAPIWRSAVAAGKPIPLKTTAGEAYLLRTLPLDQLAKREQTTDVLFEYLMRPGIADDLRRTALRDLAKLKRKQEAEILVQVIQQCDAAKDGKDDSGIYDLVRMLHSRLQAELKPVVGDLERLAKTARRQVIRQVAYVAWIDSDGSADKAWNEAQNSVDGLTDLLRCVPQMTDPAIKTALYPKIQTLLDKPPTSRDDAKLRQAAMAALVTVRGKEAESFETVARFIKMPAYRQAAIRALRRLPQTAWPKNQAAPLIDELLVGVRAMPVKDRTSPAALDAMEFADALTNLLPVDQAKRVRSELGELGVRMIRVGTRPERMTFDQDIIAVKAGKPVEFVFENTDLMPHNFVIVQPGALESVGTLAEATATDADAADRQYVPKSDRVIFASKLIQPGQSQRLSFSAPQQAGVYPFVCTYPGHWRTMHGAIYVVEDLEQYHANAEAYLASHPMTILDVLLKDQRPRTEWKYDDLAPAVTELKQGRSFAQGKQMFQVANCSACHKMEGIGQEYGPDLTQFDDKWTSIDIWKEMIDPSARINDKYQSFIFNLANGQTVTGLIVEETADAVKIVENPVAGLAPRVLKKDDIENRQKSPTSLMPKGLLDKLSRDEILDLVAYVYARGNKGHAVFQGEPMGGHKHGPRH